MKNFIIILIIGSIFVCSTGKISVASAKVRPVEIRVVDKATGSPIRNAIVYCRIGTAGPEKIMGIIPILDPIEFRYPLIEAYKTDENRYSHYPKKKG